MMQKMAADAYSALCAKLRRDVIDTLHRIGTGHPGGSLSCCEILCTLYFGGANISPENADDPARDKIVLSKGHAAPMLYRVLAEKNFFSLSEMKSLRQIDSRLQGHPCSLHTPGVELPSGPLGLAYGGALGLALADRLSDRGVCRTFAVLGDGELNEGVVWETAMAASKFHAANLITIVDHNGVQLDGTCEQIMPLGSLKDKFASFGFHVLCCDGHDCMQLLHAYQQARITEDAPTVILAHTIKGKGVSFMEGKNIWHGRKIDDEHYEIAMRELGGKVNA